MVSARGVPAGTVPGTVWHNNGAESRASTWIKPHRILIITKLDVQPFGSKSILTWHSSSGWFGEQIVIPPQGHAHASRTFILLSIHPRKGVRFLLLLRLAQGELDRELRTAFRTICGCDASPMNTDNRLDECKAKSVSARCAPSDSSLEEVTPNFRIEAGAVVFDGEHAHAVFCPK